MSAVIVWNDVLTACRELRGAPLKTTDRYSDMLDAIIEQRGSIGGWPPSDINKVVGWRVVQIAAKTFHKSASEVARDLIKRWEQHR